MSTSTPPHLRRKHFIGPLTHERLLKVCYAYRRLKEHVEHLQDDIDGAIAEFQHTQSGRPSGHLETLLTKLSQLDAGITMALMTDIHEIDLETMQWEMKSSRLKSEAKRQQRLREERRSGEPAPRHYLDNTTNAHNVPDNYRDGMFADDDFDTTDAGGSFVAPPNAPPTGAAALVAKDIEAVRAGLSEAVPTPPTNDTYKKSGLV